MAALLWAAFRRRRVVGRPDRERTERLADPLGGHGDGRDGRDPVRLPGARHLGRPRGDRVARARGALGAGDAATSGGGRCSTPTRCANNWVTTANEIHVPVGRPVLHRAPLDRRHPQLLGAQPAGKRDLIPGYENSLWFRADRPGVYRGQCAEFCGHQHAKMALRRRRRAARQLRAWLVQQRDTRRARRPTAWGSRGQEVFLDSVLRDVPRDRAARRRAAGSVPTSPTSPAGSTHRRRHAAQHARQSGRLDRGSAADQARRQDAAEPAQSVGPERAAGLPGDAPMTVAVPSAPHRAAAGSPRSRRSWSAAGGDLAQEPGLLGLAPRRGPQVDRRAATSSPRSSSSCSAGSRPLLMRTQLARPENTLLGPDRYNQFFTMHGTTMMFLFAVPVMEAMGLYLVPLMIGTRNVAFPRLNAFGYYVYLFGGALPLRRLLPQHRARHRLVQLRAARRAGLRAGQAGGRLVPDGHVHRDRRPGRRGRAHRHDLQAPRAPGMSLNRIPLFVWAMLVTSFMVLFAMPCDRGGEPVAGDGPAGRHPLLQPRRGRRPAALAAPVLVLRAPRGLHHLHPGARARLQHRGDVHAAAGVRLPGAGAVAWSRSASSASASGCTTCSPPGCRSSGASFFTAASMMIAIPSGIQIFCWIATLWAGRPRFKTPLLFVLGFVVTLRDRRPDRRHARVGAARPAGARHLLRRRPLPLRPDRRRGLPALRRVLLLVPQVDRADAGRAARQVELLALLHRLQPDLLPDAPARPRGHAAPGLHLPRRRPAGASSTCWPPSARRPSP